MVMRAGARRTTLIVLTSPRPRVDSVPACTTSAECPGDLIPLRGVADVADVKMAGEKKVGAGGCELRHRHAGSPDQMFVPVPGRQVERMMGDDDPERSRGRRPAGAPRRAAT